MNPLYNDIRYKSKIHYNVNQAGQKTADHVLFIDIPMLFFRKNIRFVYLLESPRQGDSNKHTKCMIHKTRGPKGPESLT